MRRIRISTLLLTAGVSAAALVLTGAMPALANNGPTTTTFSIGSGSLLVSVQASASLGSITSGQTTVSGALGNVTVTDNRGLASGGSWTASVISTDFTDSSGTDIPATNNSYTAPVATTTGTVTLGAPGSGALNTISPLTAQNATGASGNNTASWNPTVTVTIPQSATTGIYTATITHSVA